MADSSRLRAGDRVIYRPSGHLGTVMVVGLLTTVLLDDLGKPVAVPEDKVCVLAPHAQPIVERRPRNERGTPDTGDTA